MSVPVRSAAALSLSALMLAAVAATAGAQSPAASAGPVPTLSADCQKDQLALKNPGRLTLSTDNPAYSPWWGGDPATQYPGEPAGGDGWELGDPYSGEGYEGATAYAIAAALGFAHEEVDWIPNAVFEQAFAPGPKDFDWHMAQIAIRPARAEAVDFTDSYFDANQSIIAMTGNPITAVTTVDGLKDFKLGAGVATTALQLIEERVQPNVEAQVFNSNADAIQALQNGTIDGLVVDLQTAFYMRDAQLENYDTPDPEATVVGQFDTKAQAEQVGAVLEKGSALTHCVNEAIAIIKADGTLDAIYNEWISSGQDIPFFQ
ncbi:MAG: transporter substrate-binding domain-containing protein [Chloroflexota bacterium]